MEWSSVLFPLYLPTSLPLPLYLSILPSLPLNPRILLLAGGDAALFCIRLDWIEWMVHSWPFFSFLSFSFLFFSSFRRFGLATADVRTKIAGWSALDPKRKWSGLYLGSMIDWMIRSYDGSRVREVEGGQAIRSRSIDRGYSQFADRNMRC